ncbi:1-acyl-sn-glycerol-3-phosphate acyltransferase [Nonlabens ponticola]|uniref:1-acyl-sn-glycerol-3-phosphate acyltransferase n=1 Tax=Nonlabens ponticola TaxID=2496866 RepID=A0A3S9MWC8_9FLAO|nr:1-acyl-sn-glycerol-3-phosphate acyltransferase [Nonlabens ponticola]AZQ43423.1 1-acyl-sn-glycerol-3-phosphate acyltransferase [Nonlabens ponticola]
MSSYNDIRFFNDPEVIVALKSAVRHPMIKELFKYTFPDKDQEEIKKIVLKCESIDDFQREVISKTVERILEDTSAGLTTSGFDDLDSNTSYLYISNHRDIVLDTCLLNYKLFEYDLIRTANAIGDNLVTRPFVNALSKLTRNFTVKRGGTPRETLVSSKKLSQYIEKLLKEDKRSVWIAQRQGRTKDGNDLTEQGVLKMIALAAGKRPVADYLNSLRIIPVSISYEYDPTDLLKVPELLAKQADEEYIKSENEDFNSILKGALGQKKHIHIHAGKPLDIKDTGEPTNALLQDVVDHLDTTIQKNYHLWPTNYIAHDLLNDAKEHRTHYTDKDLAQFERRLRLRVDVSDKDAVNSYLSMYARPVTNKLFIEQPHEA